MIKKYIILFAAVLIGCSAINAQDTGGQFGAVTYCLPSTTLSFEVEAVCEIYHAGPYAAHAAKYLGLDVRRNDAMTFSIGDVKMVPLLEADQSARYFLDGPGTCVGRGCSLRKCICMEVPSGYPEKGFRYTSEAYSFQVIGEEGG